MAHGPSNNAGLEIRKAAVLGAGTMGSRIAAHLANAGIEVVLLDLASSEGARSAAAIRSLEGLKRSRPAAFFIPEFASRITPGNFEDDLQLLADCDWVIEAVAEDLEIKQTLLQKVAPFLKPDAVFTTNTSGISIAALAAALPESVRGRWFGTHFFNPPRYMRLLEIVPGPESDPAVVEAVARFADIRLGKEVVAARDTPNFIANRIGVYAIFEAIRVMQAEGLTVEDVDALTGEPIGWPRSATFRLADLIGIDVLAHIAANFPASPADLATSALPPFVSVMLERGWLGDKTGRGFYRKERDDRGAELRYALNWRTVEYEAAARPSPPALADVGGKPLSERIRMLVAREPDEPAARFIRTFLGSLWTYAAECLPEIASSAASVDRAMRAGFNWEMGPFELWDAAGVRGVVNAMRASGQAVSANAIRLLEHGDSWYRNSGHECFDPMAGKYVAVPQREGAARIAEFRSSRGVIRGNESASLVDLGDGILCIELHPKEAAIDDRVVAMIEETLGAGDALNAFEGVVISGDGAHFSSATNLGLVLAWAERGGWNELDLWLRSLQSAASAIKFCRKPVVAAPFGSCLDVGAVLVMHAARRQVHAELNMGFTFARAGLPPLAGACTELAFRAAADPAPGLDALISPLETLALARISGSAVDACRMGLLRPEDPLTMNRDRLVEDVKSLARALGPSYAAPDPCGVLSAPGAPALDNLEDGVRRRDGAQLDEIALNVYSAVAYVLCGGPVPAGTPVSEARLQDLEREAFLRLCGSATVRERLASQVRRGA